jgi:hypothetical protein
VELDALDERRRIAEHGRHAVPHPRGLAARASGGGAVHEHPIHPAPDLGRNPLHAPANV